MSGIRVTPRTKRRSAFRHLGASLLGCALFVALAAAREPLATLPVDIPPQSVANALINWSGQTGVQHIYLAGVVREQQSKGAPAGLAPEAALRRLLQGTGLSFESLNRRTVRILPEPQSAKQAPARSGEGEVLVTARAVSETSSDVPISLIVWTRDEMDLSGIKDVATLANLTPGVEFDSYSDYGAGFETNISIRGINARDGSTTAIYLNDVPLITDRLSSFGRPFVFTFDVDQVEVLHDGPHGRRRRRRCGAFRYRATQPGGLLRLRARRGLDDRSWRTQLRGQRRRWRSVAAGRAGISPRHWSRHDGGYVDRVDPFTGATVDANANWSQRSAIVGALTLRPRRTSRNPPSFTDERLYAHDTSSFYTYLSDPADGILNNGKLLGQPYSDDLAVYSLSAIADTSRVQFKSVTAYMRRHAAASFDGTNNAFWGWPNPLGPEYPVSYADARRATAESESGHFFHAADRESAAPARITWVLGAQFIHARYAEIDQVANSAEADGGYLDGYKSVHRMTSQAAAYGMLNLRLQTRLTASAGVRVERASYESDEGVGAIHGVPNEQTFTISGSSTPLALHLGLAFQADARNLYYATVAKAYRVGGPNESVGIFCSPTPTSYAPDSVWSLELGAKNQLGESSVQLDTSVFRMYWRNVQIAVPDPDCGFGYTTNGGGRPAPVLTSV